MNAITLQDIPPEILRRLEERREMNGLSLEKTIVAILTEQLGGSRASASCHDLDEFCGIWSEEEALEFDRALVDQRGRSVSRRVSGRATPSPTRPSDTA